MKKYLLNSLAIPLLAFASLSADYDLSESHGNGGSLFNNTQSGCESCSNNQVFLACLPNTFFIEGRALCFQPSSSNLHYVAEAEPLPLPSPNWIIGDIKPDYHWGFEVGAGMNLHTNNTQALLNYSHFCSKDSKSKTVPSADMVGPFFEIGPDASLYTKAKGHVHYKYDAANLDYGVGVNFGDYIHANFFAGLGSAYIKQDLFSQYSSSNGKTFRNIKVPTSYWGVGPQFGMDISYGLYQGLRLTGKSTATLLVGTAKNHTSYESTAPILDAELGIIPPNRQSTTVNKRTLVVPAYEGRLGLSYNMDICDWLVSLEAGYEVRLYFNAIQSVDMGSEVVTPPVAPDGIGVFARTFQRNISNFALAGPYITLNVGF